MTHRYATISGNGEIRRVSLHNTLAAPIDTLWQIITQVEHIKHWWPDWQPGGVIEARSAGTVKLGDGSWINGSVTQWHPPHVFGFSWQDVPPEDAPWFEHTTHSSLRIDLVSNTPEETQLFLCQYMPHDQAPGGAAGWHYFAGERLSKYVTSGEVTESDDRFTELLKLYTA